MSLYFDYQLKFINNYDINVINNSDVPDKTITFKNTIKSAVNDIFNILNLYNGIKNMTTFTEYQNKQYKITVSKTI